MLRYGFIFYGILFFLASTITYLWGDFSKSWFPSKAFSEYAIDLGLGILIAFLVIFASRILTSASASAKKLSESFAELLGPLKWYEVVGLALLSGIAEEALFRSALQPLWGIWLTTLLFALLHVGPQKHFWIWTVFAWSFGFLVGELVLWRPGLLLPATVHAVVNGCNIWWIVRTFGKKKQVLVELLEPDAGIIVSEDLSEVGASSGSSDGTLLTETDPMSPTPTDEGP